MENKPASAASIALGGMLAALALVIMCLGGFIPVATFCIPLALLVICQLVLEKAGKRIAWAWYGAVAILSILLAPDKEAAMIFLILGYYPIIKVYLDQGGLPFLKKGLFFNLNILFFYGIILRFLGVVEILEEYREFEKGVLLVLLAMGNLVFFLTDRMLNRWIVLLHRRNRR